MYLNLVKGRSAVVKNQERIILYPRQTLKHVVLKFNDKLYPRFILFEDQITFAYHVINIMIEAREGIGPGKHKYCSEFWKQTRRWIDNCWIQCPNVGPFVSKWMSGSCIPMTFSVNIWKERSNWGYLELVTHRLPERTPKKKITEVLFGDMVM